jgi:superfamily II DNA/RNA helicase
VSQSTSLAYFTHRRPFLLLSLNSKTEPRPTDAALSPTASIATSSTSFADLGVSPKVVALLAKGGIREPFPIQVSTIPDALAGRDICGKARTGSGKTLAFGLPIIERTPRSQPRRPQALVLVPTRELASQVAHELAPLAGARGLRLTAIYGGMSLFRQAQELRSGVDIVIGTPGRLNDLLQRNDMSVAEVGIVVIDEADQMADLGFLPQVERILGQIEAKHQTLLFSATLDGDVDRVVKRHQHEPVYHEVVSPDEEVSTMKHRFIGVSEEDKVSVAADIAAGPNRTLLFVRTQRGADRLVKQLDRNGVAAGSLHGGMSQPKRERALAAFASGHTPVLVATNIAARGIHVDGVDIVIHHDPPEDTKTYLHRSGRTARAGASGLVVTLVSPEQLRDVNVLRREANVRETVVTMAPGDARLADLASWSPPEEDPNLRQNQPSGPRTPRPQSSGRPYRGNGGFGGQRRAPRSGPSDAPRPRQTPWQDSAQARAERPERPDRSDRFDRAAAAPTRDRRPIRAGATPNSGARDWKSSR